MQKRIISCINFLLSKENFITTGVHSQKMKSPKRCLRRYGHADHPQSGPTMGVYTVREGVKKTFFFLLCPKHRTPPTHRARLGLH